MATWQDDARRAAAAHGLDPNVFVRQMGQEAHGDDLTSPAGAQGPAQFMPGTARSVGLNNTTVHQRGPAYNAAAKLMAGYVKQYGSYKNALVAYNAGPGRVGQSLPGETQAYIQTILHGRDPDVGSTQPAASGPSGSSQAAAPVLGDPGRAPDVTSLLTSLLSRPVQAPVTQPVAAPQFSARPALPQGFQAPTPQPSQAPEQAGGVQDALSLLGSLGGSDPASAAPVPGGGQDAPQEPVVATVQRQRAQEKAGIVPLGGGKNAGKGSFAVSGPEPGRLQKGLTAFAKEVAAVYGGKLEGLDGSTHSKYTVNGNVSEHYTGNATDIFQIDGKPATGLRLLRAGRAALIAAGMPRSQALKAPGGLYNVGNHQIIFGVDGQQYGGNHLDHLHISTHAA